MSIAEMVASTASTGDVTMMIIVMPNTKALRVSHTSCSCTSSSCFCHGAPSR